jgi:hypothetical protein
MLARDLIRGTRCDEANPIRAFDEFGNLGSHDPQQGRAAGIQVPEDIGTRWLSASRRSRRKSNARRIEIFI